MSPKPHETIEDITKFVSGLRMNHLGSYIQKAYSANPYCRKDRYASSLWKEQCLLNFPILYLSSLYLYGYAKERKYTTFLFASRDCCHWFKIFTAMFPHLDAHYFNCSRNMFTVGVGNHSYKHYVDRIVKNVDRTIFIDLHGTGRRMFSYFEQEFGRVPGCLMLSATVDVYDDFPDITIKYFKKGKFTNLVFDARGSPIEMLNYDLIGTLQNYSPDGPIRDPLEYQKSWIQPYHECINLLVGLIEKEKHCPDMKGLHHHINLLFASLRNEKPSVSRYITHQGNHEGNLETVEITSHVTFGPIISDSSVYGVVWDGMYDHHPCAVKVVLLSQSALARIAPLKKKVMKEDAFGVEVSFLAELSRLGLAPKVYGYEIVSGCGYIVMERMDSSMKDILIKRNLRPEEYRLIRNTIMRLHQTHVHGDLKPSNIGVRLNSTGDITSCLFLDCSHVTKRSRVNPVDFEVMKKRDWTGFDKHVMMNVNVR